MPIADGAGTIVQTRFQEFLQSYHGNSMLEEQSFDNMPTQQRLLLDYMAQIDTMIQNNKSTLFVDFQHIMQSDHELAEVCIASVTHQAFFPPPHHINATQHRLLSWNTIDSNRLSDTH